MVRVAFLEIGTWRMVAGILCGFVGMLLYYMGFHRMYGLLKLHVTRRQKQKWVKLFRVAYVTGSVAWAYFHAMFMTTALVWKKLIPLKNTAARLLATLCSPLAMAGIVGNLTTLFPRPINQLDLGSESFGRAPVPVLGLILLKAMDEAGELQNAQANSE